MARDSAAGRLPEDVAIEPGLAWAWVRAPRSACCGRTGEVPYNVMLTESATERIELAAPIVDIAAAALIEALARF
jgi:hypothetical protein